MVVIMKEVDREVHLELSVGIEGQESKSTGPMAPKQDRQKSDVHRKLSVGRNGELGGLKEYWRYLNEPPPYQQKARYADEAF